jgi:murein DD-endopeptidase MepM/ murein hydrolase activator NlpD
MIFRDFTGFRFIAEQPSSRSLKIIRKLATALIPAFLLITFLPGPAVEAISLRQLKQRWANTAQSISYLQSRLRPLKHKQKVAQHDLVSAKHKLVITQRNLRDVQSQLADTKTKLSVTVSKLRMIENRLQERSNLLADRLVDSYKYGSVSYLGVVMGASDFWDLLNGAHIVRKIVRKDNDLIDGIKQDKQAVEEHKATLEEQKQKRAALERQQRSLALQAHAQTAECHKILKTIQQQRDELEQQLTQELAASRQISSMIRRLQATPQGRRRMATPWHGSFTMPIAGGGRITSPFGNRFHPILHRYKLHTGTDIAAPIGTPIHAAASGIVVMVRRDRAYGNMIMLDHGGGIFTFYGHCSSIAAGTGQSVRRGQVIAYVGSTGLSTGPHVHFEVQRNGVPVSPYGNF